MTLSYKEKKDGAVETIKGLLEKINGYLNTSPVFEYAPGFILELEGDSGKLLQIHVPESDWGEMSDKLEARTESSNDEYWIRTIRAASISYEKDNKGEDLPFIESYDHIASVEETIKTLEHKDGNYEKTTI